MNWFKNFGSLVKHRLWVFWYIFKVCVILMYRAVVHDLSKFGKHEEPYYRKYATRLKKSAYGSDDYKGHMESIKPAINHHYSRNPHHPEHYKNGIHDMTLLDKIEMLCDWRAASRRHTNGNINNSIEIGQKRFDYDDETREKLKRSAKEMKL